VSEQAHDHDGNVEFEKLTPDQLRSVAVVAQALDNQWVSRATLNEMLRRSRSQSWWSRVFGGKRILGLEDVRAARERIGRMEYIRSLINTEQVIINRAFVLNNHFVSDDYLSQSGAREAFKQLLTTQALVPCFLYESSPTDRPPNMDLRPGTFEAWRRVCEETRVPCLRLNWDEDENKREISNLSLRFRFWLLSLRTYADHDREPDLAAIMASLGISQKDREAFKQRLRKVSDWAAELGDKVTRNTFYQTFITVDGTNVTDGRYDPRKPFSGELKQLADLSYNVNLPDALGRYALTPMDSLPRTALQELTVRFQHQRMQGGDLLKMVQNTVFSLAQGGLYLDSMGELTLGDVLAVRASPQWYDYITELQGLLADPYNFGDHAPLIYNRYQTLAESMTTYVEKERRGQTQVKLQKWEPLLRLSIEIGFKKLLLSWHPLGTSGAAELFYSVAGGEFVSQRITGAATATARLIIGGVTDRSASAALETSLDFSRGQLLQAQDTWDEIIGILRNQRARDISEYVGSADEYDPTINYSETPETPAA